MSATKLQDDKAIPKEKVSSQEKILKELQKNSLDEQIRIFELIKHFVTSKLLEEASSLQEAANKYLSIKERISKDGVMEHENMK